MSLPETIEPRSQLDDFRGIQPYRLAMFGEKVSLEPVLAPIAEARGRTCTCRPARPRDTMVLPDGEGGGRRRPPADRALLLDCDPPGYEMAANVGRKLQAFSVLQFPELEFEMRPGGAHPRPGQGVRLAVNADQGDREARGTAGPRRPGVEQTEIDAIATLQPDLLDRLARRAIRPFWDGGLDHRAREIRRQWERDANAALVDQVGEDSSTRSARTPSRRWRSLEQQIARSAGRVVDRRDRGRRPARPTRAARR